MSRMDRRGGVRYGRTRRSAALCSTIILACAGQISAQEPTTAEIAERYVSHYARGDVEALVSFYTEETVLADPTAVVTGREVRLAGRDEIQPFLEAAFAAVQDFVLDITGRFATGPYAVYTGQIFYSIPGSEAGVERRRVHARFAFVLEIRDGKVVRHTDYVDYEGMLRRLAEG